jgi:hypothetical protein
LVEGKGRECGGEPPKFEHLYCCAVSSKRIRQPCPQHPGRDVNASTGAGLRILFFSRCSRSVRASDPRLVYVLAVYSQSFTEREAFQLFEVLLFASASRKRLSPRQRRTFSNFGSVKGSEDPKQEPVHPPLVYTNRPAPRGKPEQAMDGTVGKVAVQCMSGQRNGCGPQAAPIWEDGGHRSCLPFAPFLVGTSAPVALSSSFPDHCAAKRARKRRGEDGGHVP